ncbi:MAG: hypothetical protein KAJ19_29775 [Gammaproteobacteria bacterium]|nr:hypothetical protein [Gammaproteobacteria bacterium]
MVKGQETRTKAKGKGRIADDDIRRMRIVWSRLSEILEEYDPEVVVVEAYSPRMGLMGGNAWKTAFSVQLSVCAAFEYGARVYMRVPGDLRRAFLGKTKGTKEQIIEAMYERVEGLSDVLSDFNESDYEHMVDAVGHAYLGLALATGD